MVRAKRRIIQLLTKVISRFEYFICTSYRVSEEFYKGLLDLLVGIGQGNVLSRNIYWDILHLVIKVPENKKLEIIIIPPISKKEE